MHSSSPTNRVVNVDESIPTRVLEYAPKKFDLGVPEPAKNFIEQKRIKPTGFKMAETVRIQTGLDDIEAISVEDAAEAKVLEKLKDIQEGAYKEAFNLGLEEGKKEAFQAFSAQIEENLKMFEEMLEAVKKIKSDLLTQNETHLAKLAFFVGERLANHEITTHPEMVTKVIAKSMELAQGEENITVLVSPNQLAFLETLQKENNRELEFLKTVKLVPLDTVRDGGCVIQTNYGEIDARVEERVAKLWDEISNATPRVKEQMSA